ncbi:hypothetical protein [Mycobacterium sp. IDR2000157661]|uniref:hypothetical protein n=1 Tax=Mycobacterium sp. IDR2000157661 TaxID=2867005 RepID=UPI001EEA08FB|nr:hypothetical protein [Mycobacterium sp. IDR2000157661]ULE32865.1 hypothetical protein K3G64_22775 [Mycobacterium sp. IDR2000157661]
MEHTEASGQPTNEPAPAGGDFEYDEAHDFSGAQARGGDRTSHQVTAPTGGTTDVGGDFGYDEAHDFRAR